MALGQCDVGDKPEVTWTFYSTAVPPVATDPTTVKVVTRNPSGTEVVYTYPASTEITKPSTGTFKFTFPQITVAGTWYVRCNGTGTVTASFEDSIAVNSSAYTTPLP